MKATVVTTITTLVDSDTFATEHSLDIEVEEGMESIGYHVALGACRTGVMALEGQLGMREIEEIEEGDE